MNNSFDISEIISNNSDGLLARPAEFKPDWWHLKSFVVKKYGFD